MNKKSVKANLICGITCILFSLWVWFETASFPEDKNVNINSDFFPRMMAIGLIIASLSMIFTSVMSKKEEIIGTLSLKNSGIQRALICLVLTILVAVLLKPVGFIIVSIVYAFIMMYILGDRKWIRMIIVSILVPLLIFFLFSKLLGITLPLGILKPLFH